MMSWAGRFHVYAVEAHRPTRSKIALGSPMATIDERAAPASPRSPTPCAARPAATGRRAAPPSRRRRCSCPTRRRLDRPPAAPSRPTSTARSCAGRHDHGPHPAGAGRRHRRRLVGDRRHRPAAAVGRGSAPRPRRRRAVRLHERRDAADLDRRGARRSSMRIIFLRRSFRFYAARRPIHSAFWTWP